jgi:cation:H+ antiporter
MWKSMGPMIGSTIMCIVLGLDGIYSRWDGAILFGSFLLYTLYLYYDERKYYKVEDNLPMSEDISESIPRTKKQVIVDSFLSVGLMTITVLTASQVLKIAEILVDRTNVSGSMLGVITLGIASALPELTTALVALRQKEAGISLGTLIGSNITNPLVGIGAGALVSRYAVPTPLIWWDLPWETLTGIILWLIVFFRKGNLTKVDAFYLMGMYFVFITLRVVPFKTDF